LNGDRRTERREEERRRAPDFRLAIPRELRDGWLALQGLNQRLRLSPIPEGWQHLSDEELCRLVMRASAMHQERAS
jgi:hypothetical protein